MDTVDIHNIIPITELRRNFGAITENLVNTQGILLTKDGKPFAILKSSREEKRKLLRKSIGAFKGTPLENPDFWKKLTRKSRKDPIVL